MKDKSSQMFEQVNASHLGTWLIEDDFLKHFGFVDFEGAQGKMCLLFV